jgi:RimJ/RimL family protein N-acetyltransferase
VIVALGEDRIDALVQHLVRNARESGRDGDAHSRASSADEPVDVEAMTARLHLGIARPLSALEWQRWWVWLDGAYVRGHVDLRGAGIMSALHRARLGIGLERGWRGQGTGEALMRAAIAWAAGEGLAWIDLGVFEDNTPARALYRKLGFEEVGVLRDAFRVDGRSLDDVSMALPLRGPRRT